MKAKLSKVSIDESDSLHLACRRSMQGNPLFPLFSVQSTRTVNIWGPRVSRLKSLPKVLREQGPRIM